MRWYFLPYFMVSCGRTCAILSSEKRAFISQIGPAQLCLEQDESFTPLRFTAQCEWIAVAIVGFPLCTHEVGISKALNEMVAQTSRQSVFRLAIKNEEFC